jgi:endonuclease/exonuclease/phosphatase family metal-dependent hydrolase
VLLSRWPLHDVVIHDLSVPKREPRLAIEARVLTEAGPLRLVTTHCGLFPAERRHQGAILAELARDAAGTVVIAGDFNDWSRRGPATRALSREMPARTTSRTFPARLPLGRLDRIYCRPATALVRSWTDPEARVASDHLPLIADLAITP